MKTPRRSLAPGYVFWGILMVCLWSPRLCEAQLSEELYRRLPDSLRPIIHNSPTLVEATRILKYAFDIPEFGTLEHNLTDSLCYQFAPKYKTIKDPAFRLQFLFFVGHYLYNSYALHTSNKTTLRGNNLMYKSPHAEIGLNYCDIYLAEYAKTPTQQTLFMANILLFKAYFQMELDQYKNAFYTLKQMKDIAVSNKVLESEALSYITLSFLFETLSLSDQALTYADSAFACLEKASLKTPYGEWAHGEMVNIKQSKQKLYAEKFSKTNQEVFLDSVYHIHSQIKMDGHDHARLFVSSSHITVATLKYRQKQFREAIAHLDSAGNVYPNITNTALGEQAAAVRGLCLMKLGRPPEAIKILRMLHFDISVGMPLLWALNELVGYELNNADSQAVISYQDLIIRYKDRRHNLDMQGKALEMEQLYKAIEKDNQIAKLKERQNRNVFISLFVIVSVLTVLLIFFRRYRSNQRKNRDLIKRVEETMQMQLIAVETARYQERKSIGQQLHDDLASSMTGTLAYLRREAAEKTDPHEREQGLFISKMLEESYHKARGKSHELYLEMDSTQFWSRFSEQVELLLSGTDIHFALNGEIEGIILSVETKTNLIMIVKEAVTNVIKHSRAKQMEILLYSDQDDLVLEVTDNGKGFFAERIEEKMGLKSIRERMTKLGGALDVVSEPQKGTTILARLPIEGAKLID